MWTNRKLGTWRECMEQRSAARQFNQCYFLKRNLYRFPIRIIYKVSVNLSNLVTSKGVNMIWTIDTKQIWKSKFMGVGIFIQFMALNEIVKMGTDWCYEVQQLHRVTHWSLVLSKHYDYIKIRQITYYVRPLIFCRYVFVRDKYLTCFLCYRSDRTYIHLELRRFKIQSNVNIFYWAEAFSLYSSDRPQLILSPQSCSISIHHLNWKKRLSRDFNSLRCRIFLIFYYHTNYNHFYLLFLNLSFMIHKS